MFRFDAEEMLRLIEAHHITQVQVVPAMLIRLLQLPEPVRSRYDLSSLTCIAHGAAPCPVHVKEQIINWFGPIVSEAYGGSEAGLVTWTDTPGWLAHPGTVGRPDDGSDVRILAEDGSPLGPRQAGQVYVRPPEYLPDFTYLGDPAKRAAIERDGYLSLGDIGYLDEDGYLYLTDRASDIVISGGVNIYPAEIEQVILKLAGVRDVAVVGIPDDTYGEALAAHVAADPAAGLSADSVRNHLRGCIASYKIPRLIVFDDHLPREDSGKLFKRRLRELYWARSATTL